MFFHLLLFAACLLPQSTVAKLVFKEDGTFKILHISDIHYERPSGACEDISESQLPCSHKNSTDFLEWLIATENPDIVVHTGDIIDWDTNTSEQGMTEYYNISNFYGLPWATSLGNHDDDGTNTNRSSVIEYIVNLPGSLTEVGDVKNTYGNFILEIYSSEDSSIPAFRTYHFDSDTHAASITSEQVDWYKSKAEAFAQSSPAPALAFYHIPLTEYVIATKAGIPYTGGYNEVICNEPLNTGLFDAFKDNDVVAGFCGHDHTNDFCVPYQGVKLCYEGSAGFNAYGSVGYARRTRVTEIRDFGNEVVSWKRLDTSIGGGVVVDVETLWTSSDSYQSSVKVQPKTKIATKEFMESLPKRSQKSKH